MTERLRRTPFHHLADYNLIREERWIEKNLSPFCHTSSRYKRWHLTLFYLE